MPQATAGCYRVAAEKIKELIPNDPELCANVRGVLRGLTIEVLNTCQRAVVESGVSVFALDGTEQQEATAHMTEAVHVMD